MRETGIEPILMRKKKAIIIPTVRTLSVAYIQVLKLTRMKLINVNIVRKNLLGFLTRLKPSDST